jgi:hypothetical protein
MRTVAATRYVAPLREGGSLPAIVEGSDDGLYVAKFRGAGHGTKALVAEVVAGELARAAGLLVPEIVLLEVGAELGRNEPDAEIRDLLKRSVGLNIGLDYLPGSATFDPVAGPPPSAAEASEIVLFDGLVSNVDRTAHNTNLLCWHRRLWLIDHGSSLHFHYSFPRKDVLPRHPTLPEAVLRQFNWFKDHVLLRWARELPSAGARLASRLGGGTIERVVAEVPDALLPPDPPSMTPATMREAYVTYLEHRLAAANILVQEAERARALLV